MANKYLELKKRFEEEFSAFPMKFAFSEEQFVRGMTELGLDPEKDKDKVCTGFGGGFFRKTDKDALIALLEGHDKELTEAIEADKTGDGFAYDMFYYELANHEYSYTMDLSQTLDALGMTFEAVQEKPILLQALTKAAKQVLADSSDW